MKKLLLALGLSSLLGLAQAQSLTTSGIAESVTAPAGGDAKVTAYGVLDIGYLGTTYQGVGANPKASQNTSQIGNNLQSPSRLGLRGTEQLGGGTSAFFVAEAGLNPANSALSSFNNRQTFVGLKQRGLGEFAFGVQQTPIFNALFVSDPGKVNGMIGNVIAATNPQLNGNSGSGPFANGTSSGGTSDAYTVRTSNTFSATTDRFSGLQGVAMYTLNNTENTSVGSSFSGTNNFNGWGLGANYLWRDLFVTANYQAFTSQVVGTLVTPTTLVSPSPALWSGSSGGVNTQDNQTYVAATYDFGIVKGYAQWINRKATSTLNSNYFGQRSAQQVGVRGFWTPTIESWASIGNGRIDAWGPTTPTANFIGYQVGTNYFLSKRTNLYAMYGQNNTSSTGGINGTPSISSSSYGVGVKTAF
jgi:predicted porin